MLMTINYTFSFVTQDVDQAKSNIEECITSICKWMDVNELKLNHDKTEIMMFHSKFRVPPAVQSLRVGMENVNLSSFAKSLGVTFDDTMSFNIKLAMCANHRSIVYVTFLEFVNT